MSIRINSSILLGSPFSSWLLFTRCVALPTVSLPSMNSACDNNGEPEETRFELNP
ncbi:MAG: hypothetical protein KZQ76_02385 [Candidatus Thiodiazotropha sp. (ex Epidulcina cf. delphinae)]|nr:hypothetical protein [Candidatus Thiodiazotropha sp. (ex Epidulcina cf. delphinae)]